MSVNPPGLRVTKFGTLPDGQDVTKFVLSNGKTNVCILDLGAVVSSIKTPDKFGKYADIVLGYDNVADYAHNPFYLGGVIGRYANRIREAKFKMDDQEYELDANDGRHFLHGGHSGFHNQLWSIISKRVNKDSTQITLQFISPAGEAGFPGKLTTTVTYSLDANNQLSIKYAAITTAPTHINLTNHSYFNLEGHEAGSVNGHVLHLAADRYLPLDTENLPTGEMCSVKNGVFDFSIARPIETANSYDHCYVLAEKKREELHWAGQLCAPHSGRTLDVWTDQPGIQIYAGNFLDNHSGKNGATYKRHAGLCLETQHFPDSPNQPHFPTTLLRPGDKFTSETVFGLGIVPT